MNNIEDTLEKFNKTVSYNPHLKVIHSGNTFYLLQDGIVVYKNTSEVLFSTVLNGYK